MARRLVARKPYTSYSREFKVEALRLARVGDKPKTQVARDLGIRVNQLQKWKEQLEGEVVMGAPAKRGRPEASEVEQLSRENARLKEENDILKKAAIYFARELK
jgi:transposase